MKQIINLLIILLIATACFAASGDSTSSAHTAGKRTNSNTMVSSKTVGLIGKTATITFPQFSVDETFISDTVVHWKIVSEKGEVTQADEAISYKKINDHQFFVNWIEKTGLTVSQVLDPVSGTATAFVSRADEKSDRGQRSASFFQGTCKIKNE